VIVPSIEAPPRRILHARAGDAEGWLVLDTLRDGLAFGGTRFSPFVDEAEVKGLARAMTWKLAVHGQPVGGCKAGIRCRPSAPGVEHAVEEIARQWSRTLEEDVVLGKDMGASDALIRTLHTGLGRSQLAAIAHKDPRCPLWLREFAGYLPHMTGQGVAWAAEAAIDNLAGRTVAIQGAGAVGIGTAVRVIERGARVVAMSDIERAVLCDDGIPIATLTGKTGLAGVSGTRAPREAVLGLAVDVLVLAAGSNAIAVGDAQAIRAGCVIEAANFGLTDDARRALHAARIPTVPDIVASSSSAAFVAHQLRAAGQREPAAMWNDIRDAIVYYTRVALEPSSSTSRDVVAGRLRAEHRHG